MQDSLGGNTKTRIIATLSPSWDAVEESISTLKFADRAKQVMVFAKINKERQIDPMYVQKLELEIARLQKIIESNGIELGTTFVVPSSDALNPHQFKCPPDQAQFDKLRELVIELTDENRGLKAQQIGSG